MGRKKSESIYKKVIVKWYDAINDNDTAISIEEAINMEMPIQETIGYLLKKTKQKIVLAGFYDHENQQVDVVTVIPRQWAIQICELK